MRKTLAILIITLFLISLVSFSFISAESDKNKPIKLTGKTTDNPNEANNGQGNNGQAEDDSTDLEDEAETTGNTKTKVKIKGEDVGVSTDLEIEGEGDNMSITDSSGKKYKIKMSPEQIRERIRERLRLHNDSNISLQLQEKVHNNVPRVVYNIETNQNGKFLGIFKIAMKSSADVDVETGEVLEVNRPWWAFLISIPEEGSEEDEEEQNEESSLTYEQALVIAQNSDCVLEGNLTEEYNYNSATGTWWIEMEMFEEQEGCNPACVVSEETQTAEINYRCTGLIEE